MSRVGVALGLVVMMALASSLRAEALDRVIASSTYEDVYYLPPAEWLPVMSLGWREALADLLWCRALVYFGDELLHRGALAHVYDYTDAMLALDPEFRAVYLWVGMAGLYRPTAVSREDALRALDYLRRGVQRFPSDGELAWDLGATLAFEMPSHLPPGPELDALQDEGAIHLMRAARLGAAPSWAVLSNAALLTRVGRRETAARHLEEMYALTTDEEVRARIAGALARYRTQTYAEGFAESERIEEERRLRELPYLPPDLYFLIGPAPVLDWARAYREGFAADALADETVSFEELE